MPRQRSTKHRFSVAEIARLVDRTGKSRSYWNRVSRGAFTPSPSVRARAGNLYDKPQEPPHPGIKVIYERHRELPDGWVSFLASQNFYNSPEYDDEQIIEFCDEAFYEELEDHDMIVLSVTGIYRPSGSYATYRPGHGKVKGHYELNDFRSNHYEITVIVAIPGSD